MHYPHPGPINTSTLRARSFWLLVAIIAGALVTAAQPAVEERRCFEGASVVCVEGRFLAFWERHGGVDIFGAPVTNMVVESTPDGAFTVQYFARARLELHPANAAPYDVLLGRIGAERLRAIGRSGATGQNGPDGSNCRRFPATGLAVCGVFLNYWRRHGLQFDDDPAVSEQESLALLGLPLTAEVAETGPSGEALLAQWFERARLVRRADGAVTLAPLGQETVDAGTKPPAAENTPVVVPVTAPTPPAPAPPPQAPIVQGAPPVPEPAAASSPTPEPVPVVPLPAVPCNRDVPIPANGLQLWVIQEEDQAIACVRLILGGDAIRGAGAMVYRHYGGETRPSIAHTTGGDGVAGFIFYTGRGSPGLPTHVEAVVSYRGVAYRATTWLTER